MNKNQGLTCAVVSRLAGLLSGFEGGAKKSPLLKSKGFFFLSSILGNRWARETPLYSGVSVVRLGRKFKARRIPGGVKGKDKGRIMVTNKNARYTDLPFCQAHSKSVLSVKKISGLSNKVTITLFLKLAIRTLFS